jgi:hypothetical protein
MLAKASAEIPRAKTRSISKAQVSKTLGRTEGIVVGLFSIFPLSHEVSLRWWVDLIVVGDVRIWERADRLEAMQHSPHHSWRCWLLRFWSSHIDRLVVVMKSSGDRGEVDWLIKELQG